jgi:hypothetical protein
VFFCSLKKWYILFRVKKHKSRRKMSVWCRIEILSDSWVNRPLFGQSGTLILQSDRFSRFLSFFTLNRIYILCKTPLLLWALKPTARYFVLSRSGSYCTMDNTELLLYLSGVWSVVFWCVSHWPLIEKTRLRLRETIALLTRPLICNVPQFFA